MLPWKTIIQIKDNSEVPVYLQIANAIISEIRQGHVGPSAKLPGTRLMSSLLQVHRKTVVRAYEELDAQGWITQQPSKGTFTSKEIPEIRPRTISPAITNISFPQQTGFTVRVNKDLRAPVLPYRNITGFHDGPDVRLVPSHEIGKAYKSILQRNTNLKFLSYVEIAGVEKFRRTLSDYLNSTRGLRTTHENIMITRGSQMAMYLLSLVLFKKGDNIIVGDTNYYYADHTFMTAGMNLVRVDVDEQGMNVEAVEKICRRKKIKALYITSHHHYPTTVTLAASRRMKLITLAQQYGIIIIEDDYDYDFHYLSSPILPLVSADTKGMVVYIGTLSKTVAAGIRTGYVIAPPNLILEMCRIRQLIDTQGDAIMELALSELFNDGTIRRHMKKALNEYHRRRDFVCEQFTSELSDVIEFKIPDGGLALWAKFDQSVPLPALSQKMKEKGIIISNGLIHDNSSLRRNCTRIGFGWMNEKEAGKAISILKDCIRKGV
jgi:GntR family transcriptional regulator / MocR family aminotransferase